MSEDIKAVYEELEKAGILRVDKNLPIHISYNFPNDEEISKIIEKLEIEGLEYYGEGDISMASSDVSNILNEINVNLPAKPSYACLSFGEEGELHFYFPEKKWDWDGKDKDAEHLNIIVPIMDKLGYREIS